MIVDRTLTLSVASNQAAWAQSLLDRNAIPVENPFAGRARGRRGRTTSRRGSRGRSGRALKDILGLRLF
jgi:hypothetical protein